MSFMATQWNVFRNKLIFDPHSQFMVRWNNCMFVVGLINFYVDPMFMYIPIVNGSRIAVSEDLHLGLILATIRTVGDIFRFFDIVIKFCTAYEAPGSRVFKRILLVKERREIAINYFKSTFILDLIAILPLPQINLRHQILASSNPSGSTEISDSLNFFYWIQLLPRLFVVIHSKAEVTKTAGVLMRSAMSGACYNLLWFISLSNIYGAVYYHMHIYWIYGCGAIIINETHLKPQNFEWDQFISNCTKTNKIEQGIFTSGLINKIGTKSFLQKYMFCFSWGLKSLSSLGQNFTTSFSTFETAFSIFITLCGLIFFADLITRMQGGIQSMEEREEQQRARQREVKEWMDYHQLSLDLKERVDHAIQSEWTENGIDDEVMLDSLPVDLRSEIRKYLYLDSVSKLPKFANMDAAQVEAICQHLKTFSGKEGTYIVFEGDIVKQMLFIFSGQLELSFTNSGYSSATILEPGDCCGQELVTWASQPTTSMDSLPCSSWTIKCLTDVEAFVLQAYDMKILATRFAHNQNFQHAFKQHYP